MIGLVLGVLIGIGIGKSGEAGSQARTGTTETYSEQPPPTYSEQESWVQSKAADVGLKRPMFGSKWPMSKRPMFGVKWPMFGLKRPMYHRLLL